MVEHKLDVIPTQWALGQGLGKEEGDYGEELQKGGSCHSEKPAGNKVTPSRRHVTGEKKIDVYTNRVKESQCGHKM